MLHEVVEAVTALGLPGMYVDATFGHGAYAAELLRRLPHGGRLTICVDGDAMPTAAAAAQQLKLADSRVAAVVSRTLGDVAAALAGQELAGVVVDLGAAWDQDDQSLKGLSCIDYAPLDLRASPTRGIPASEWLQRATVAELAWVLHAYGEDDDPVMALRLAEAVLERQRRHGPYETAYQLAEVARRVKSLHDERGLHPAKRVLQALRVFINGELEQFQDFLEDVAPLLVNKGRMAVVSTRRAEASAVKSFMRRHENWHGLLAAGASPSRLQELYPLLQTGKPFAVAQASQPIWPAASSESGGRRPPRTLATHVLQRVPRVPAPAGWDGDDARPRSYDALFLEPLALPFAGGVVGP